MTGQPSHHLKCLDFECIQTSGVQYLDPQYNHNQAQNDALLCIFTVHETSKQVFGKLNFIKNTCFVMKGLIWVSVHIAKNLNFHGRSNTSK